MAIGAMSALREAGASPTPSPSDAYLDNRVAG